MRLAIATLAVACAIASPSEAEAEVVAANPAMLAVVTLGTVGGLTSSVGAIVFSLEHRTFTSGWVVTALFSTAICGAMTTALIVEGARGGNGAGGALFGAVFYAAITLWPGYWTVRSALAEAPPGESLDGTPLRKDALDPAREIRPHAAFASVPTLSFPF